MKQLVIAVAIALLGFIACNNASENKVNNIQNTEKMDMSKEREAATELLLTYGKFLNASDTKSIVNLYTKDGVFMPTGAPTAKGSAQLEESYNFVFSNIQLTVEFDIEELEVTEDGWAYAMTQSHGSTLIHATGETVSEANRELFVLRKVGNDWKIARYMFNKTK